MDSPASPNLLFLLFLLSTFIVCSKGVTSPVIVTAPQGQVITVPSGTPATVPPPSPPASVSPPAPSAPVSPSINNNPPPAAGPPPATGQGSWCVVKPGVSTVSVQAALDFACGAGADCRAIQPGGACFSPSSLQSSLQVHASYAFSSYCQGHKGATCDFGGVAVLTNANPSTGGCNYPALTISTSPTSPTTTPTTPTTPMTPMTPTTPTTPMTPTPPSALVPPSPLGGLATPPTTFNGNSPPLGGGGGDSGFGSPQTSSTNSISLLSTLQQTDIVISCVILVTSIITGVIGFDM